MALYFEKKDGISIIGVEGYVYINSNTTEETVILSLRQFEEMCNRSKSIIAESKNSEGGKNA